MDFLVYFGHMDARTRKCMLRFRKAYAGPCGRTGLETPSSINLRGCTEPASGLYEAREIPYEVHRIQ